jgi:hypothetical protein
MLYENHIILTEKEIMGKKKHFVENKTIMHYVFKMQSVSSMPNI